jgi:hypothetical protein
MANNRRNPSDWKLPAWLSAKVRSRLRMLTNSSRIWIEWWRMVSGEFMNTPQILRSRWIASTAIP